MPTATIRIPAQSAQVVAGHLGHGVDVLASVRLDLLADALGRMEHDDLDPGERRMNADQCRDALLRELLGGWSPSELVEAKIPGVLQMADEIVDLNKQVQALTGHVNSQIRRAEMAESDAATLRRERDEARRDICVAKEIMQDLLDRMLLLPPDQNCSCHISPPCNDCMEYGGIREAIEQATAFITTPTPGAQP